MIKKLIISSLVAISVVGIMPVAASATWKQDASKNSSWVEKGVVAKGWKKIDGEWYNFDNDGRMRTGWMMDNGNWYYLWSNGTMADNTWLTNGNFWYYLDASGKMVQDSAIIQNRKYDFTKPAVIFSNEVEASVSNTNATTSKNN